MWDVAAAAAGAAAEAQQQQQAHAAPSRPGWPQAQLHAPGHHCLAPIVTHPSCTTPALPAPPSREWVAGNKGAVPEEIRGASVWGGGHPRLAYWQAVTGAAGMQLLTGSLETLDDPCWGLAVSPGSAAT